MLRRMLGLGLRLLSLRGLGLVAELRASALSQVRAAQCTALAALSLTLAALAGFSALLLWVDPDTRPTLLAGAAAAFALTGLALLSQARSLRRHQGHAWTEALRSLRGDLSMMRQAFGHEPAGRDARTRRADSVNDAHHASRGEPGGRPPAHDNDTSPRGDSNRR